MWCMLTALFAAKLDLRSSGVDCVHDVKEGLLLQGDASLLRHVCWLYCDT